MAWFKERFFPDLPPEERERRLDLFRLLLYIQIGATVLLSAITVIDTRNYPTYILLTFGLCGLTVLFSAVGFRLARRGFLHGGAFLLVLSLQGILGFFILFYGTRGPVPYLFVWPILVAAMLLEPAMLIAITTLAALIYGGVSLLEFYQVWPFPPGGLPIFRSEYFALWHRPEQGDLVQRYIGDTLNVVITYYSAAMLAWIAARSLRREVARTREQAAELRRYRDELEKRVQERTAALERTMASLEARLEEIREMGSPVLPLWKGVLLVPLIGTIDSERARRTIDRVLEGTAARRARVVILDITGVPLVDTAVANALVQTAQGVRLLGATPVLVGMRAEVAQTIVSLGVDLSGIVSRAGLQEGLTYALEQIGVEALSGGNGKGLARTAGQASSGGKR